MAITAAMVKELRELTGAGMMDCKKALTETDGNMEAAIEVLKKSGAAKMEKKASRIAAEGITRVAIKDNTAVVTEVNSETDFVAKNETFQEFVQLVADNALASGLEGGANGEDIILPVPPVLKAIALLMVGLGNGPAFPNLTCLVPKIYGKEVSGSIIGTQMVACNLGICLMPPLFGVIADIFSVALFPVYITVLFLILVISSFLHFKLPNGKL